MTAKHALDNPRPKQALSLSSFLFGALIVFGFTGPMLITSTTGIGFTTVLTGSMQPNLNPGDLAITQQIPASNLEVGDVVSLVDNSSYEKFMHRVTAIDVTAGNLMLLTKGDNNPVEDFEASMVPTSAFVPKQIGTIAYLGSALKFIQTPTGSLLYVGVILLGIGGLVLVGKKKHNKSKGEHL